MAHWMTRVARAQSLAGADGLDLPPSLSTEDAWARAQDTCGVTRKELADAVARTFKTAVAELSTAEPMAIRLVPASVARRFRVFPVRDRDRSIEVATADPTDAMAEQEISFAAGRSPLLTIAPPEEISLAIESAYSPEMATAALLERIEGDLTGAVDIGFAFEEEPEAVSEAEIASGPVVRLTNLILNEAIRRGASDIHVQPRPPGGVVRFRVDGVLMGPLQMPLPVLLRVVSRIKILGDLDIADRLRPQDGRARIIIAKRPYDLRISTVPTRNAEKAVIRILDASASTSLEDTGIQADELERIGRALEHRSGIFVVTGPTGSGKTTTLYAALKRLTTDDVNIMTVEDPVEYELPGLTQIQVDPKQGVTFASALRAILRQDPDVIFVGEIRDSDTAQMAVQASLTGHLVLATLHANDALGSIRRLLDLGLDRGTIAEVLRGSLAQRLVRRMCRACATAVDGALSADEALLASELDVTPVVRAPGCEACAGSGYAGRAPVTEFLGPTDELAALILEGASMSELRAQAEKDGMRTLLDCGRQLVRSGVTSLQEVRRVLGSAGSPEGTAASPVEAPEASGAAPAARGGAKAGTPEDQREGDEDEEEEGTHVLLVDDDGTVRSIARAVLEKEGYRVSDVNDGSEALARLARGEQFSLMVLDLDMPMLGGREVLRAVRGSLATGSLPVVVLTATSDHDAEVQLFEQGADDYIRKPIEPRAFLARVNAALRRQGG